MRNSVTRFSDRVENYVLYRPTYPTALLQFMEDKLGINKNVTLADVGSGTGILTEALLNQTKYIYAVEPNTEMRKAAENLLIHKSNFESVAGSSENTLLDDNSVDAITVAQAFHWFDIPKSIAEFKRISKDNATLMLIWNRRLSNTPFLKAYEEIIKLYGTDFNKINHQQLGDKEFSQCFVDGIYNINVFNNYQVFDFYSFIGFMNSHSYIPSSDTAEYQKIFSLVEQIFDKYSVDGLIQMNYATEIYWGKVK